MTDALVYAVMQNIMDSSDTDQWDYYKRNIQIPTKPPGGTLPVTLNTILDETTIKRACCRAVEADDDSSAWRIRVRIPTPKDHSYGTGNVEQIEKKYGYVDVPVNVPKTLCDSKYTIDSKNPKSYSYCDDFNQLYCDNIIKDFRQLHDPKITDDDIANGKFPYNEFKNYKPDCACYAPITPEFKNYNIPPSCIMPDCIKGGTAYLGATSRVPTCNLTICEQTIIEKGFKAGHDIFNEITTTCGTGDKCRLDGCKICDPTNSLKCTKDGCHSGYTFNSDTSQCIKDTIQCPINCKTCSGDGKTCTGCNNNYGLIGTDCIKCTDTKCVNCDGNKDKCKTCINGYAPDSTGKCVKCTATNCKACDPDKPGTCLSCNDGYYLDGIVCKSCKSSCKTCAKGTTCASCKNGYYLDSNNQCQKCYNNCVTCDDGTGDCNKCMSGYQKKNGQCVKKPSGLLYEYIGSGILSCLLLMIVIVVLYLLFSGHKHRVVIHK